MTRDTDDTGPVEIADRIQICNDGAPKVCNDGAPKEGLVYAVNGSMRERRGRKKRIASAALAMTKGHTVGNPRADAITMIRKVRALAEKAGGMKS